MPAWLFTPSGILGVLLAAVSLYAVTITKMYGSKADELSTYRATVELAQEQAAADAALRLQRAEAITKQVGDDWAVVVADLHKRRVVRVLPPASRCPETGALPVATTVVTQATTQHGLDSGFTEALASSCAECDERLNKSIEASLMVLHLQDYVLSQHEASK